MVAPINYKSIIEHEKTIIDLRGSEADITVILPVRGRKSYLDPCAHYFKAAAEAAGKSIGILVVEDDDTPSFRKVCEQLDVSYVFIHSSTTRSSGMFAKSACYNIGFLLNPNNNKWTLYHDLDIIVDINFFSNLWSYINRDNLTWLQPYTKRRVRRLNIAETTGIIGGVSRPAILGDMGDPSNPGSHGGSVLIKREDFISVGGFDPEYFYGYAPEDSFIWAKLEYLYSRTEGRVSIDTNSSNSKAVYADSPAIEMYHLYHPSAESSNPDLHRMNTRLHAFMRANTTSREAFLKRKMEHMVHQIEVTRPIRDSLGLGKLL